MLKKAFFGLSTEYFSRDKFRTQRVQKSMVDI
jgi:hypothetical protein